MTVTAFNWINFQDYFPFLFKIKFSVKHTASKTIFIIPKTDGLSNTPLIMFNKTKQTSKIVIKFFFTFYGKYDIINIIPMGRAVYTARACHLSFFVSCLISVMAVRTKTKVCAKSFIMLIISIAFPLSYYLVKVYSLTVYIIS